MSAETLIVGGGLAGAAAATTLARGGMAVRVLEREAGAHDKVCGEFLSVEAGRDMAALGIDPAHLGAVSIDCVRLVAHGREIETRLPFVAHGLSRRVMDEALLELAERAGAHVERGVRVSAVAVDGAQTSAGARDASRVLVATGKHGVRGAARTDGATPSRYVGFKLHLRLPAGEARALAGVIELLPFAGGYAGFQLVSADTANLCLVVRQQALADAGGSWDALLATLLRDPTFARRIEPAQPLFARPLTIANLAYGHLGPRDADGLYRLGDQAAMTASLTGDGMAGALAGARIVAACILAGGSPDDAQQAVRGAVQRQVRRAMLLQRITELPLALRIGTAVVAARPGLLRVMAAATRLPGRAMERTQGTTG